MEIIYLGNILSNYHKTINDLRIQYLNDKTK